MSIKPLPLILLLFAGAAASAPPLAKLEPVVVTATLRPVPAAATSGRRQRARGRRRAGSRRRAPRGTPAAAAIAVLGRRELAAALLPAPRHRRTRAVPGRAESVGRLPRRRDRLQRHRHDRLDLRRRAGRGAARSRRARATARTRSAASSRSRRAIPCRCASWTPRLSLGGDGLWSAGAAAGGALPAGDSAEGAWRAVLERAVSDGFRDNRFLGRDDTNGRDETTARLKFRLESEHGWRADLALLHADFDNGYDAFAIDNSFTTLSDRPGRDSQRSDGASLDLAHAAAGGGELRSITAWAESDIVASFDGDWGNERDWGAAGPYDFFSDTRRTRRTLSEDLRLSSAADGARFLDRGPVAAAPRGGQPHHRRRPLPRRTPSCANSRARTARRAPRSTDRRTLPSRRRRRSPRACGSRSATPATTTATASPSIRATGCGAANSP